ncbi:hypothetical protein D9757_011779 [Collybiopsis confluens]|uniref:Uncharacterized protein n=1 Tax=Collybiopsis confluens TaxID=2823264 RepID=A0A8H5H0R8_9AGAR|nr:hypothetical protein D9757_011779 [Collybiopsis confluens]
MNVELGLKHNETPGAQFQALNLLCHWAADGTRRMRSYVQILKGAYRNGHISATQQAAQHIVDFMAALDEYDFGDANVDLNDEYNV